MGEYRLLNNGNQWRTAHRKDGKIKGRERNIYSGYTYPEYDNFNAHLVVVVNPPKAGFHSMISCYVGIEHYTWHKIKPYIKLRERHNLGLRTKTGELDGVIYCVPDSEGTNEYHKVYGNFDFNGDLKDANEDVFIEPTNGRPSHPNVGLYADRTYYLWHYYPDLPKLLRLPLSGYNDPRVRGDMHTMMLCLVDCYKQYKAQAEIQDDINMEKRHQISQFHIDRLNSLADDIKKICSENIDIYDKDYNNIK